MSRVMVKERVRIKVKVKVRIRVRVKGRGTHQPNECCGFQNFVVP